ncbi:MAG: hypothetical protein VX000_11015 [Myxococcota bacterium]|nr:hypothetical protein [Myxococcota bacterium]
MRPFWTRFLQPQDKPAHGGAPVKTLRHPSDEAQVPDPAGGPEEPEVFTMRFPTDDPEVPEPQGSGS